MKLREGIVEKVIIQSDYIYMVVRRVPVGTLMSNSETGNIKGELFGANGTPESMLSLAEVMIPTDINPSIASGSLEAYIGRQVPVLVDKDRPLIVLSNASSYSNSPRAISGSKIKELRALSRSGNINTSRYDIDAKEILDGILSEKWEDIQGKSAIITYDGIKNWSYLDDKDTSFTGSKLSKEKVMMKNYKEGVNVQRCFLPKILIGGRR